MKKNLQTSISILLLCLVFFCVSCSNDDADLDTATHLQALNLDGRCDIYSVNNSEGTAWSILSAPEWIVPVTSKGNLEDKIDLYVENNILSPLRSGDVIIAFANGATYSVAVNQSNEQTGKNLERSRAIGWGIDLTTYMDSRGLKDQIFNTQKILNYDSDRIVDDKSTAVEVISFYETSIDNMKKSMSAHLSLDVKMNSFDLQLNGAFGKSSTSNSKRFFSMLRGKYTERAIALDIPSSTASSADLFTHDFSTERQRVIDAQGSDESIRQLINRYGTHYVTNASLGGYLDYYMSFVQSKTTDDLNIEGAIQFGFNDKFKINGGAEYKKDFENMNEERIEKFFIRGGDAINLTNLVVADSLKANSIDDWRNTLTDDHLELIDFDVKPISNFFPSDIKTKINNYINRTLYYNNLPVTRSSQTDNNL